MNIKINDEMIESLKSIIKNQMIESDDSLSDDFEIDKRDISDYINILIENNISEFNHRISR